MPAIQEMSSRARISWCLHCPNEHTAQRVPDDTERTGYLRRMTAIESVFTVAEVAERLKVDQDTVRRMFIHEPGVIVICFPRKGRRTYRTVRIPEAVLHRVVARFTAQS
jgi:hypothetical protein